MSTSQNETRQMQRLTYIDALKGFAILCVVLGHIARGYISAGIYPNNAFLPMVNNIVYVFHMPLFFMLSGFLFEKVYFGEDNMDRQRADDRCRTQILNFVIIYFVYAIFLITFKRLLPGFVNNQGSVKQILLLPIHADDLHWYLYVLIELYLIFSQPLVRAFSARILLPVLMVVAMLAKGMGVFSEWFHLNDFFFYAPFFYVGMLLYRKKDMTRLQKAIAAGGILSCTLCVCSCVQGWIFDEKPVVSFLAGMGLSLFLFSIFSGIRVIGSQYWLSFIGRHSMEIYLFHVFFTAGFRLVDRYLKLQNVYLSVFCNLLLSTGLPICAGCILEKLGLYTIFFRPMTFIKSTFLRKNTSGRMPE